MRSSGGGRGDVYHVAAAPAAHVIEIAHAAGVDEGGGAAGDGGDAAFCVLVTEYMELGFYPFQDYICKGAGALVFACAQNVTILNGGKRTVACL